MYLSSLIILLTCTGLWLGWRWNTQPQNHLVTARLPADFPLHGFSHRYFSDLLEKFVDGDGKVDYKAWLDDAQALQQLDQYLAAVARFSPDNAPQRFNEAHASLIYWVYAYNAQVIRTILRHWPLHSVTDLRAPVEIIEGLGFFYNQYYLFGGESYNLYQIENGKIFSGEADPRVHFILNCGSESCPILRPQLPLGEALEPFLQRAAEAFIAAPENLTIDTEGRRIYLSAVFKWYREDFLGAVQTKGEAPPTLRAYLQQIASESLAQRLAEAKDYALTFRAYDWSLNQAKHLATESQTHIDGGEK